MSNILRNSLLAAGLALGLGAGAAAAEEIRVLNWQGYGTDEAWSLDAFKAATGIDVVHEYFNSEQEMLTKLRTNPGAYDVVLINSAFTAQAASEGLIQPIDTAMVSNFADLSPNLAGNAMLNPDGKVYGVAWVWGVTSFAVNSDKFNPLPETLEVLWDPANAGRIALRDDAVENVAFAALATGQDINNPADMAAIGERLKALKPQIRTFWSSEDQWNQLFSAGEFDLATYWSGSAGRSKTAFGLPVEFIIPKEGAIGWLDGLSIAAGSTKVEAAAKFINWMIDPAFYVQWDTTVGAPASANAKANAGLPEDAFNRAVLGDPAKVAVIQFMAPLSDETREGFLKLWEEMKTFYQQ